MSREADPAQREQVAQRRAELVGGRLAHGREAPVVHELDAVVGAEVRLRVADVDDEQHHGPTSSGGPGAPHVLARRAAPARRPRARGPGTSSVGPSSSSGTSTKRREVTSRCGSVSRSDAYSVVAEQQHVDVDRPRPVLDVAVLAGLDAPERALDRLARVQQRLRAPARVSTRTHAL